MDTPAALQLLLQKNSVQTNDLIHKVIEEFQKHNIRGAESASQLVPLTQKNINDHNYSKLLKLWREFKSPLMSVPDWLSLSAKNAQHLHNRARNKERARLLANYEANLGQPAPEVVAIGAENPRIIDQFLYQADHNSLVPPHLSTEMSDFSLERALIKEDMTFYALDPYTLDRHKIPLKFSYEPSVSHYSNCLEVYPLTSIPDLNRTLVKCLQRAQKLGYTREQFGLVLKAFIEQHSPNHYFSIQNIDNPDKCFQTVISLIYSTDILPQINSQLRNLTRNVNESIHAFYAKNCSLLTVKLSHTCPHLTEAQIEAKAQNIAKLNLPNFLEEGVRHNLIQYVKAQNCMGNPPEIGEYLQFIRDLELASPQYALQGKITHSLESELAIFNNELSLYTTRTQAKSDPNYTHQNYQTPKRTRGRGRRGNIRGGAMTPRTPSKNQGNNFSGSTPKTVRFSPQSRERSASANNSRNYNQSRSNNRYNTRQNFGNNQRYMRNNSSNYNNKSSFNNNNYQNRSRRGGYNGRQNRGNNMSRGQRHGNMNPRYRSNDRQSNRNRGSYSRDNSTNRRHNDTYDTSNYFCLRCESRKHSTHTCPHYFVTTLDTCLACGSGRHYQRVCKGALVDVLE